MNLRGCRKNLAEHHLVESGLRVAYYKTFWTFGGHS